MSSTFHLSLQPLVGKHDKEHRVCRQHHFTRAGLSTPYNTLTDSGLDDILASVQVARTTGTLSTKVHFVMKQPAQQPASSSRQLIQSMRSLPCRPQRTNIDDEQSKSARTSQCVTRTNTHTRRVHRTIPNVCTATHHIDTNNTSHALPEKSANT